MVATIALASLAGNPAGGALADRCTPRRALMAGLMLAAAGSAALAAARTGPELFAAAGLLGLGVSVIWPAQDALLASLAGPANRSSVFAVRHACFNAGLGVGALAAAAVVSAAHPATFTAIYAADAASFLAFVHVLARLRRRHSPPASRPRPPSRSPPATAGRYNGLGTLAFTTGFLLGPATGGAALGAGWGTSLFASPTHTQHEAAGHGEQLTVPEQERHGEYQTVTV